MVRCNQMRIITEQGKKRLDVLETALLVQMELG